MRKRPYGLPENERISDSAYGSARLRGVLEAVDNERVVRLEKQWACVAASPLQTRFAVLAITPGAAPRSEAAE
jgi:hypothetical protein